MWDDLNRLQADATNLAAGVLKVKLENNNNDNKKKLFEAILHPPTAWDCWPFESLK